VDQISPPGIGTKFRPILTLPDNSNPQRIFAHAPNTKSRRRWKIHSWFVVKSLICENYSSAKDGQLPA
jgi:hypothetical protein